MVFELLAVIDQAEVPRRPARPNRSLNLLLGLFGGGIFAVGRRELVEGMGVQAVEMAWGVPEKVRIELRRWVIGPERGSKGRRRGLSARLADIASYDEAGGKAIAAARDAAEALPSDGWLQRLGENAPSGPLEALLAAVRATVYARDESGGQEAGYGLETEAAQLDGAFVERAQAAQEALAELRVPLVRLGVRLEAILAEPPDWLDGAGRARIEGARHSLASRIDLLSAWEALLERLGGPADPEFVDWLAVERSEAREFDIGIHRRWLDPMKPFARTVLEGAHGVMLTSATLRDGPDWDAAIAHSGAAELSVAPRLSSFESPFDYAGQAEVLIVTDVPKGDISALAGAYARLIEAAGGGALARTLRGLFRPQLEARRAAGAGGSVPGRKRAGRRPGGRLPDAGSHTGLHQALRCANPRPAHLRGAGRPPQGGVIGVTRPARGANRRR